jgi:hypothetical protein
LKKVLYLLGLSLQLVLTGCQERNARPEAALINDLQLKRGEIIACTTGGNQFGSAEFQISAREEVQEDFNLAIQLLHSFEYDEAEKMFAQVIDEDPGCAMA